VNILDPLIKPFSQTRDPYRGMDPETRVFLQTLADADSTPMEKLSPVEARHVLEQAQQETMVDLSGIDTRQLKIDSEGHVIELDIVRPAASGTAPLPVVMFFHGGGWVLGDFPTHKRLVRDIAVLSGCAVVFVNYTRSPDAEYPTALIQAYLATKWIAENGHEVGLDGQRLAVAGNSAGGNMATAVCLMAKDRFGPTIRHQTLFWPVTDANFDTGSYEDFEDGYFLTRNMMKWFWDNYTSNDEARAEVYASPLKAAPEQLQGLPPALIQTAECDVLRDEGEAYARLLNDAGVKVTATRYIGTIHDFGLLNALALTPPTRAALNQAAQEIRKHLA
jgi:acetyl esterase/lipase